MPEIRISPSNLERVLLCKGSAVLASYAPREEPPEVAREGTAMHAFLEHLLKGGAPLWALKRHDDMEGYPKGYPDLDEDQQSAVFEVYEYLQQWTGPGWTWRVEDKLPPPVNLRPYMRPGRCDFTACGGALTVVADAKFGRGTIVTPERSPQLVTYLAYVTEDLPAGLPVVAAIAQPRAFEGETFKEWHTTVGDIRLTAREFEQDLSTGLFTPLIHRNTPELTPGVKQCKYCPARTFCPKLGGLADDLAAEKELSHVEAAALGERWHQAKAVEQGIKAVKAEVERRLNEGKSVPGCKLIDGNGSTVPKEPAKALDLAKQKWGDDVYEPRELRSWASMRDKLPEGKDFAKLYFTSQPGRPRVVEESHPKPAVVVYTPQQRLQMMVMGIAGTDPVGVE